jgi:hypothetical protein
LGELFIRLLIRTEPAYRASARSPLACCGGPLYADEVNFNGKTLSRSEVLTAHRLFFERWPERSYKVQDKSMNATCGEVRPGLAGGPVECVVTGTEDFAQRSIARNAVMSGVGKLHLRATSIKRYVHYKGAAGEYPSATTVRCCGRTSIRPASRR